MADRDIGQRPEGSTEAVPVTFSPSHKNTRVNSPGRSFSNGILLSRSEQAELERTQLLNKAAESPIPELKQAAVIAKSKKTLPKSSSSPDNRGRSKSLSHVKPGDDFPTSFSTHEIPQPATVEKAPQPASVEKAPLRVQTKKLSPASVSPQENSSPPVALNLSRHVSPSTPTTPPIVSALHIQRAEEGLHHELKCITSLIPRNLPSEAKKSAILVTAQKTIPKLFTSFISKLGKEYSVDRFAFVYKKQITDKTPGTFSFEAPKKTDKYRIKYDNQCQAWLAPCIELENNMEEKEKLALGLEYGKTITTLIEKGVKVRVLLTERSNLFAVTSGSSESEKQQQLLKFENEQINKWLNFFLPYLPTNKGQKIIHSHIEFCFVGKKSELLNDLPREQVIEAWETSPEFQGASKAHTELFISDHRDALEMSLVGTAAEYVKRKLENHSQKEGSLAGEEKKQAPRSSRENSPSLGPQTHSPITPPLNINTTHSFPDSKETSPVSGKSSPSNRFKELNDLKVRTAPEVMAAVTGRLADQLERNLGDKAKVTNLAIFVATVGKSWVEPTVHSPEPELKTGDMNVTAMADAKSTNPVMTVPQAPSTRPRSKDTSTHANTTAGGYRTHNMFAQTGQDKRRISPPKQMADAVSHEPNSP